jgi:glycosyltransferase involved in cell wall biosynthesis
MHLVVSFTKLGPYHLARLRALASRLAEGDGRLTVIETAGREQRYPWDTPHGKEPFQWLTLFPERSLEELGASECWFAMAGALDQLRPDSVAVSGYVRPECLSATRWAQRRRKPRVLMSESQAIDRPRIWWKEHLKRRRIRRFHSALVGGPRHRDYLVELGMPSDRISFGYNAVDHNRVVQSVDMHRVQKGEPPSANRPKFLAVSRLAPEKNLSRLLHAFARYRKETDLGGAWDLTICGDGAERAALQSLAHSLKIAASTHFAGFLQELDLDRFYASAAAFVHVSTSEPWGLVVNEAAAAGLPLIVSSRAGCVDTLVPEPAGTTGIRIDPENEREISAGMRWISTRSLGERAAIGRRAREVASAWGPRRFAEGAIEALEIARRVRDVRSKVSSINIG